MARVKIVLIILILIFLTIFVMENISTKITITFFGQKSSEFPAILAILFSIFLGCLLMIIGTLKDRVFNFKKHRQAKKPIDHLAEKEENKTEN